MFCRISDESDISRAISLCHRGDVVLIKQESEAKMPNGTVAFVVGPVIQRLEVPFAGVAQPLLFQLSHGGGGRSLDERPDLLCDLAPVCLGTQAGEQGV